MPRVLRLLAPALAALLVLAGLTTTGPAAVAAVAADPMAGAPAVGSCYDLTYRQAGRVAAPEATVPCSEEHTLRVVALRRLPSTVGWDAPIADRAAAATLACRDSWRAIQGRTPRRVLRSLYQPFWFEPSAAQKAAAARWVSCELGLEAAGRLLALPAGTLPRAGSRRSDPVARCLTRRNRLVVCADRHAWRATHAFATRATGGRKAVERAAWKAAARTCGRQARNRPWRWSWEGWSGKRIGVVCYSRTRR